MKAVQSVYGRGQKSRERNGTDDPMRNRCRTSDDGSDQDLTR